jgi:hypothetical protein
MNQSEKDKSEKQELEQIKINSGLNKEQLKIFNNFNIDLFHNELNNKLKINENIFKLCIKSNINRREIFDQIFDLIRLYGYVITKKDVLYALNHEVIIKNLPDEYFKDENFTNDYIDTYEEHRRTVSLIYPYNLKATKKGLISYITSYVGGNYKKGEFEKFVKKYDIKPDTDVLYAICKDYSKHEILICHIMNTYDVDADFRCLISSPYLPGQVETMLKNVEKC